MENNVIQKNLENINFRSELLRFLHLKQNNLKIEGYGLIFASPVIWVVLPEIKCSYYIQYSGDIKEGLLSITSNTKPDVVKIKEGFQRMNDLLKEFIFGEKTSETISLSHSEV